MENRNWSDLTSQEQTGLLVAASVQIALAAAAWTDLARRPSELVRGPKLVWAAIIAVNFVGPIAYFVLGRRRGARLG
ncbi:PLD nuclease N-terminal domain-containing protein [Agromyces sp. NPDC049794]|uniref:PLD nuclease N-terminal domain-containing protein n=1 Tax=unclassified Agromyces TaxID=2639701 RepID=UPI0033EC7353